MTKLTFMFFFTIPYSITVGWAWPYLMIALFLAEKPGLENGLVVTAQWRPWFAKRFPFSMAIGRGVVYHPAPGIRGGMLTPTQTQFHEHVHIRQIEDMMLVGFLVAAAVLTVTALAGHAEYRLAALLWFTSAEWRLLSYVASFLRGERLYEDAEPEKSARAQSEHLKPMTIFTE